MRAASNGWKRGREGKERLMRRKWVNPQAGEEEGEEELRGKMEDKRKTKG